MSKSLGNFIDVPALLKEYSSRVFRFFIASKHYRSEIDFSKAEMENARASLAKIDNFIGSLLSVKGAAGKGVADEGAAKAAAAGKEVADEGAAGGNAAGKEAANKGAAEAAAAGKETADEGAAGRDAAALITRHRNAFISDMDNDFNTPKALAGIFEFVREANRLMAEGKLSQASAAEALSLMKEINCVFSVFVFSEAETVVPEEIAKLVEEREEARKNRDFRKSDELRVLIKTKGYTVDDAPEGPRVRKAD
jgi:cysteinyl-tRNA synthetase